MLLEPRAVAHALGGDIAGRNRISVPGPEHSPRDRSLSILINSHAPDGFVVHSFAGDDAFACKDYVRQQLGIGLWTPKRRAEPRSAQLVQRTESLPSDEAGTAIALRTFKEALPVLGTLGDKYLSLRVGRRVPWPQDLRFHPSCFRNFGGRRERHPAVVALLRDIHTNAPCGIQRTFLKPDGSDRLRDSKGKAALGRSKGACIKLSPNDEVTLGLGLGEGVETCLSMMARGWLPIWCTGGTSGLAAFPVLNGIEALTVFADSDENQASQRAALQCIARWREAGLEARGIKPRTSGRDWNDVTRGAA